MAQQDLVVVRAATQWSILNNPTSPMSQRLDEVFSTNLDVPADDVPAGEAAYMKQTVWMEFNDGTFFSIQAFKDGYRSYANKALATFLENGGIIEGQDDILVPETRALLEL